MVQASSDASGQQDAALPLVVEHQGQQSHHEDEDDSAADEGVGDAGVVAQVVVQCHKVLPGGFCREEWVDAGKKEKRVSQWGGSEALIVSWLLMNGVWLHRKAQRQPQLKMRGVKSPHKFPDEGLTNGAWCAAQGLVLSS